MKNECYWSGCQRTGTTPWRPVGNTWRYLCATHTAMLERQKTHKAALPKVRMRQDSLC